MSNMPVPLVSPQWLIENLGDPDVLVLDCSYHMPATGRDAADEFANEHIPGARFFDFDGRIRKPDSPLPHMLPDAALFAREAGALGISNRSRVVCYDAQGLFSAARGWWMMRVFGHDEVAVLDGGLPQWKRQGGAVASGGSQVTGKSFSAQFRPELVIDRGEIEALLGTGGLQVIDARSADRFYGRVAEPRAGMRSGRIPGALSQPFAELLDNQGCLLARPELEGRLEAGDAQTRLVASCGSGVTACILALAHFVCGRKNVAVYDGSWAEWGADESLPIDSGDNSGT